MTQKSRVVAKKYERSDYAQMQVIDYENMRRELETQVSPKHSHALFDASQYEARKHWKNSCHICTSSIKSKKLRVLW